MMIKTKPAPVAGSMFHGSALGNLMLRGPNVAFAPEDDGGAAAGDPPGDDLAGTTDQTADPAASGEDATPGDQPAADAPADPAKPKKPTFQERMDEKTRLQREAERERDAERAEKEALRAEIEALKAKVPQDDPSDDSYIEEIVERRLTQREQERRAQELETTWTERQSAAAEKYDDYFEAVIEGAEKLAWACTPLMRDTMMTSELGADVAYHLAKNPDEARRIAALEPISQVRELGKLEVKLTPTPAAPKPKTATDAPEPHPQARGGGGKFKVDPATSDFAAFDKQYGG
jgi:hypothetical protein